jgi:hypothetical protein
MIVGTLDAMSNHHVEGDIDLKFLQQRNLHLRCIIVEEGAMQTLRDLGYTYVLFCYYGLLQM